MKFSRLHSIRLLCLLSLAAASAYQGRASANLGGDPDSVATDRVVLRGLTRMTPMTQYDVHEISIGSNSMVREYVTREGTVFAVTWRGPTPPNLQQLFGNYFTRFKNAATAAAQAQPGGHRQFTLTQPDFVVQTAGHLRAFQGRAYLPALIPAGVSLSDLN